MTTIKNVITIILVIWTIISSAPVNGATCSMTIVNLGPIASSNYPNNYGNGSECWTISVSAGHALKITFQTPFDLAVGDTLEIIESSPYTSGESAVVSTHTGQVVPPVYTSIGGPNRIEFRLITNGTSVGKGFKLDWEEVAAEKKCGGELTGTSGSLTSPNHPADYGVFSDCTWTISVPWRSAVRLTFDSQFDIEGTSDQNYLKILETIPIGGHGNYIERKSYTGSDVPPVYTSTNNEVKIHFRSGKLPGTGFKITWDKVASEFNGCGGTMTGKRGSFASPNYPFNYGDNSDCTWRIEADSKVYLRFYSLRLEEDVDTLTIYDAWDQGSKEFTTNVSYTGYIAPPSYHSYKSILELRLTSNSNTTDRGFYAIWEATQLFSTSKVSSSPGIATNRVKVSTFKGVAKGDLQDEYNVWDITVAKGKFIKLIFPTPFDLQPHEYYKIYERSPVSQMLREVITYTGGARTQPPSYTTTSNTVDIEYRSVGIASGEVYTLNAEAVDTRCGGVLNSLSGAISSPQYPDHYNTTDCTWLINVPTGSTIQLAFQSPFDTVPVKDIVKITEISTSGERRTIGRYSGDKVPVVGASTTNRVEVQFQTSGTSDKKGFRLTWETIGDPCGGTLKGKNGSMTSPQGQYYYYDVFGSCTWIIEVPVGDAIHLAFQSPFNLGNNNTFNSDALKVYDISTSGESSEKRSYFGETTTPANYTSTTNRVMVVFKADTLSTDKGFAINWNTVEGEEGEDDDDDDDDDDNSRYLYALFAIPCIALLIGVIYLLHKRSKASGGGSVSFNKA